MKQHPLELICPNGDIIRGFHQEPFSVSSSSKEPVVMIFCHGFPSSDMDNHDQLFLKLQNTCAQLGIHSVRFDFRGCGTSDVAQEDFTLHSAMEDLDVIANWTEQQKFPRIMITTEGLGFAPALISLSEVAEAGVFFWPVFDPHEYAVRNMNAEAHKDRFSEGGYFESDHGNIGIPLVKELYEIDLVPVMNQVKFPCLIQHGVEDDVIPIDGIDMAKAHFRNRRIEITTYQDGKHGLMKENHRKYVMYHYEQFIEKYL